MHSSFVKWVGVCVKKYASLPYKKTIGRYVEERKRKRPVEKAYLLSDILRQQNRDDSFDRLDIIVRLLAIENEMHINQYGWDLYFKMQSERCNEDGEAVKNRIENFRQLIHKMIDYKNIPIVLDSELKLYDGSHRMALAIYNKTSDIKCLVNKSLGETDTYYGNNWFVEHGFNPREIELINNRLLSVLNDNRIRISFLLWPSVSDYFDEIEEIIIEYGFSIARSKNVAFDDDGFGKMIRKVYSVDDVAEWKIEKKIEYLNPIPNKCVRYYLLEITWPHYRTKEINGNLILIEGERLKDDIRKRYMNKVKDYYFDIICHSADNSIQSSYIDSLF